LLERLSKLAVLKTWPSSVRATTKKRWSPKIKKERIYRDTNRKEARMARDVSDKIKHRIAIRRKQTPEDMKIDQDIWN